MSSRYAELEDEYERLLVEYRNTEEALAHTRRSSAKLESQLYAASRQVENAKRVQGEFLDTISHELLTPLNGILGMARILDELPLKPDIQESVNTISSCGEELESILRNLLDYIHLSKGEIDFIPKTFDLEDCINQVLGGYVPTIYAKNIEITYLPNHGIYNAVEVDRDRFEQILHILLSNAAKFTHKGHIVIKSHIKQKAGSYLSGQPGHELILSVKDTGIGISADDLQHIFRPFEQLDSSRNRNYGGIGIGLTLCKEIISQMGGSIMIDSEPGEGSIFAISLPVQSVSQLRNRRPSKRLKAKLDVLVATTHETGKKLLENILADLDVNHLFIQEYQFRQRSLHAGDILIVDYPADPLETPQFNDLIEVMHKKKCIIIALLPTLNTLLPRIKSMINVVVDKPLSSLALADGLAYALTLRQPLIKENTLEDASLERTQNILVRVLLADNNPVNQKIVQHLLGMLDCYVDTVNSMDELNENYKPEIYSSVVINPSIDPNTNLSQIKAFSEANTEGSRTPIIAITGSKSPFTLEQLKSVGVHEHITLPTRLEVLSKALQLSNNKF